MSAQFTTALVLFFLAIGGRLVNEFYTPLVSENIILSLFVLAGFFTIRFIVSLAAREYVADSRKRYTIRKSSSVVLIAIAIIILLQIWVEDPQSLLVAYGLVAAGVAVALKDVFKNFAGGIAILTSGMYRVGNRISISKREGDVIDIGFFYTTLLEVGNWVDGDQSTGRIITIPNGKALSETVQNYSRDHHYLWDEISLPVTYGSDRSGAMEIMTDVAGDHTADFTEGSKRSITEMERRYYVSERQMKPSAYMQATDNWVLLTVRYVVAVGERRRVMSDITADILRQFEARDDISIASETVDIVGFPDRE